MNKLVKAILAMLGATEAVFSIFIPITIALLLVNVGLVDFSRWQGTALIAAGIISSLYRAIYIGLITKE